MKHIGQCLLGAAFLCQRVLSSLPQQPLVLKIEATNVVSTIQSAFHLQWTDTGRIRTSVNIYLGTILCPFIYQGPIHIGRSKIRIGQPSRQTIIDHDVDSHRPVPMM